MKLTVFCALLAFIAYTASPLAFAEQKGAMIYGAGISSCGKWTRDKTHDREAYYQNAQWVLGFLSALNKNDSVVGAKPAKQIDADGRMAFIDQYCSKNPLDSISNAALSLYMNLKGWRK